MEIFIIFIYKYINIGSRKKTTFHPDKPVSWSLTLQGILMIRIFITIDYILWDITLYFNISSTLLRKNRNTDLLYIYMYIYFRVLLRLYVIRYLVLVMFRLRCPHFWEAHVIMGLLNSLVKVLKGLKSG